MNYKWTNFYQNLSAASIWMYDLNTKASFLFRTGHWANTTMIFADGCRKDSRLLKQVFFSELAIGEHKQRFSESATETA